MMDLRSFFDAFGEVPTDTSRSGDGRTLAELETAFLAAVAAAERAKSDAELALSRFESAAPPLPKELTLNCNANPEHELLSFEHRATIDLVLADKHSLSFHPKYCALSVKTLSADLADGKLRSRKRKLARTLLPIAEAHEAAVGAALEASQLRAKREALKASLQLEQDLAEAIFVAPPATFQDLVVKARTISAARTVGDQILYVMRGGQMLAKGGSGAGSEG